MCLGKSVDKCSVQGHAHVQKKCRQEKLGHFHIDFWFARAPHYAHLKLPNGGRYNPIQPLLLLQCNHVLPMSMQIQHNVSKNRLSECEELHRLFEAFT